MWSNESRYSNCTMPWFTKRSRSAPSVEMANRIGRRRAIRSPSRRSRRDRGHRRRPFWLSLASHPARPGTRRGALADCGHYRGGQRGTSGAGGNMSSDSLSVPDSLRTSSKGPRLANVASRLHFSTPPPAPRRASMRRARCSEERARSALTPGIAEAEPTETRFEPRDLGARCRAASPAIGHRIEGPCRAPLKRAYCSAAAERYRPARASLETAGCGTRPIR